MTSYSEYRLQATTFSLMTLPYSIGLRVPQSFSTEKVTLASRLRIQDS